MMKNTLILLSVYIVLSNSLCFAQTKINIDFMDHPDTLLTQAFTEEGYDIKIHNIKRESEKQDVKNYVFFQNRGDISQIIEKVPHSETNDTITFEIRSINASSISIIDQEGNVKVVVPLGQKNTQNPKQTSSDITLDIKVTGIPIYDAVELKRLMDLGDTTTIRKILNFYSNEAKYKSNPLFDSVSLYPFNTRSEGQTFTIASFGNLVSQVGGTNVTTFVDGLAQFVIERATEELNVAFFYRLEEQFQQYPEFKTLFPSTIKFLSEIEISMYASFLQALQEAFKKDCIELSYNFTRLQILESSACTEVKDKNEINCEGRIKKYQDFFKTPKGLSFLSILFVTDGLIKGKNPADLIVYLSDSIENRNEKFSLDAPLDYVNSLRLSKLISESIRSKYKEEVYASQLDIKKVLADSVTFRIYLGLLYEQNDEVKISIHNKSLQDILKSYAIGGALNNPIQYLEGIAISITGVNQNVTEIKAVINSGRSFNYTNYSNYYNSIIDLVEKLIDFEKLDSTIPISSNSFRNYLASAKIAGNIYYDVSNRKYSSAILNTVTFLNNVNLPDNNSSFKINFIKYGNFIGNVAQAQSASEVKGAIEAVALPTGSSSIKKKTPFNIALNTYIGGHIGRETIKGVGTQEEEISSAGIMTPVGIAFSWPLNVFKDERYAMSFSLFTSIIDIAPVTTYRLSNQEDEIKTEITLENIISPGIYGVIGVPVWPLSVGVGWQTNPNLSKVTVDGIEVNTEKYTRFSVFLAVDIPIINLYTVPKRKR